MKVNRLKSLLLAASFCMAPAAQAAGMIVIDPIVGIPMVPVAPVTPIRPIGPGHRTPVPRPPMLKGGVSFGLRLQGADIKVDITDQVAKTYITQTFINDTDRNLAGTYLFPLPDDTTFSSFSLHIDGKPIEGKILEANEARQEYEQIVRRMVDPGLLEYADYKTVRARIFPIPAHGTKKVELEYTQILKAESGLLKYRFPLKTDNNNTPADELKVAVNLKSKQGLRTIWSPSHTVCLDRTNDHLAKVAFAAEDTVPDKDFLLYYNVSDKDLAANVLTHKGSGEDGYYLLTVTPPVEAKQGSTKDLVLVVDTSGSMQGERMEENKKALKYLVNALNAGDKFNIVQFDTDVDHFSESLVLATPDNKKKALAYVHGLEARGGTNIGDALRSAVTMLDHQSDRPGYMVLMTDGEPTVGETSVSGLLKVVHSKRDIRVFDFGVGYDVNTKLLNQLAESHHGTAQYVEPDESLETALSSFYQKIKTPVLSNVHIAYDGIETKDVYPREVKDIFAGSQVVLVGKYKGSGNGTVRLTGTVNGVQKAYSFPVSFASQQVGNTYLPRLWAMRRIGHLTQVAQDNGNTREVVDEIIALSKKYGIISAYTSFLVTDPSENQRLANNVPVPRPMVAPSPSNGLDFGRLMGAMGPKRESRAVMPMSVSAAAAGGGGAGGSLDDGITGRVERKRSDADKFGAMVSFAQSTPAGVSDGERARRQFDEELSKVKSQVVGKKAVLASKELRDFKDAVAVNSKNEVSATTKTVEDKTFYLRNGYWTDSDYNGKQALETIAFGSKQYFELLKQAPGIAKYLSVGRQAIVIFNGKGYKITFSAA